MIIDLIARGLQAKRSGDGWMAKCPAHDDHNPSLSVTLKLGKVLLHCHSGCTQEAVVDALRGRGLWPSEECRKPLSERIDAEYSGLKWFARDAADAFDHVRSKAHTESAVLVGVWSQIT
jgi:hypothetical protein